MVGSEVDRSREANVAAEAVSLLELLLVSINGRCAATMALDGGGGIFFLENKT